MVSKTLLPSPAILCVLCKQYELPVRADFKCPAPCLRAIFSLAGEHNDHGKEKPFFERATSPLAYSKMAEKMN